MKSAVLHSNGETLTVTGNSYVKNLLNSFGATGFGSEIDEDKSIVFGGCCGCAFIEITWSDGDSLGDKTQCNNLFDCGKADVKTEDPKEGE